MKERERRLGEKDRNAKRDKKNEKEENSSKNRSKKGERNIFLSLV